MNMRFAKRAASVLGVALAACWNVAEAAETKLPEDAFALTKPGAVKPTGWLRDWAEDVAKGYTARMDEVDDEFKRAWREDFQPRGKKLHWSQGTWSCEGGAYWFDGLVKLGFQLGDAAMQAQAKRRLDPLLDRMTDHPIGFCWWLDRRDPKHFQEVYDSSDWMVNWVAGAMARPLAAWYAATGDVRAKRALEAALGDDYWNTKFKSQAVDCVPGSVISIPSGAWAAWRETKSGNILAALRTYAEEYARRPTRETYGPAPTNGLERTLGLKRSEMFALKIPIRHGVVCQESLHSLFVSARLTGDAELMKSWRKWMDFLYVRARLPLGTLVMDEEWGQPGPRRGVETCALAAETWGRINYLLALGDGRFGDSIERAFFNAAPATMTRDCRAHVYFQTPNRLKAGDSARLSVRNDGRNQVDYKEKTFPLCCTAGLNRLVPDYVQAMWMTTADGGVAATLYGPCTFETQLAGGAFAVREETDYPFADTIRLTVEAAPQAAIPLKLRLPHWCAKPELAVNGKAVAAKSADGFASLTRAWRKGDTVTLRLPMSVRVRQFHDADETQQDHTCVSLGPLLFARGFAEKSANEAAEKTSVPAVDPATVQMTARVFRKPMPRHFDWPLAAPVTIETRAADGRTLELVPYGCTKLRAACLKTVRTPPPEQREPFAVRVDATKPSERRLPNPAGVLTVWNARGWTNRAEQAAYPVKGFVDWVEMMACTGGNAGRDLFKDRNDRARTDDYDFAPLVKSCREVLAFGAKPYLKLGNVPAKFTADYDGGEFSMNVRPPTDHLVHYRYLKACAAALKAAFGLEEVRSWRYAVLTEADNFGWFKAKSGDRAETREEFYRLYDYAAKAFEEELGTNLVFGTHLLNPRDAGPQDAQKSSFSVEDFVAHCACGTNRATGKTGAPLGLLTISAYSTPDADNPSAGKNFKMDRVQRALKAHGYTDVVTGVDEGRVITCADGGRSRGDLIQRVVGHSYQAAYDVRVTKEIFDTGAEYFAGWGYFTGPDTGVGGIPSFSYFTARETARFAGMRRLPVKLSGRPFEKEQVDAVAALSPGGNVVRVMVGRFRDLLVFDTPFAATLSVQLPPAFTNQLVTVSTLKLDDTNNWFTHWYRHRGEDGITSGDFGWSGADPTVLSPGQGLLKREHEELFRAKYLPLYERMARRIVPEAHVVRVSSDGIVGVPLEFVGNGAAFVEVSR